MMREGLFVPGYWDLLSNDARIAAYNGVGPQYFPERLRNLLDIVFWWGADAIRVHDVEYVYSASKLLADIRLLVNLLRCSKLIIRRIALSFAAFIGVFFFGGRAFREGRMKS